MDVIEDGGFGAHDRSHSGVENWIRGLSQVARTSSPFGIGVGLGLTFSGCIRTMRHPLISGFRLKLAWADL